MFTKPNIVVGLLGSSLRPWVFTPVAAVMYRLHLNWSPWRCYDVVVFIAGHSLYCKMKYVNKNSGNIKLIFLIVLEVENITNRMFVLTCPRYINFKLNYS